MKSTQAPRAARLAPAARRAQILSAAADLALADGLERVTLRAVADRLEVRHGLITHYFNAAEDLVVEAFIAAASADREVMFPAEGTPLERIAHLARVNDSIEAGPLARLWLNARHLSRFSAPLAAALAEQDAKDHARLREVIDDGVRSGDFVVPDAASAAVRILLAVDGVCAYANDPEAYATATAARFVAETAEHVLGLERGALRRTP
ncbi:TetR family transcriptional regulator [Microbacterium sp.]|uniref:TetR family transcriptional regulator n=1 Tax=Microbacterium sp. TaxID=51671 RepID=UPI00281236D6|nr:TetR family transcriptional regulator [Microbacterium sp.]